VLRRNLAIVLTAALAAAALVLGRDCLKREESPSSTAQTAPGSAGPSAHPRGTAAPRPRPAGSAAEQGGAPEGPAAAISAPWGGQLGQLGRDRPAEGNPEGPMSFAVDGKGRGLVLDRVNSRLVRYGAYGKPEAALPINLLSGRPRTSPSPSTAPWR